MNCVTVEELELLSFFGVEPARVDQDIPWPYTDFSYLLEVGGYTVSFRIAPAYKDLSLSVAHNGSELYSVRSVSIKDVRYHRDADRETLEIAVSDRDTIWFRLRPSLLITQEAGECSIPSMASSLTSIP
jgi:hypothetical protein